MKTVSLVALCALITGCVAVGGDDLTVTFNSDVSAGIAQHYADQALLGPLPSKVTYDIANTPVDEQGCFLVSGVQVTWQSGYMASTPEIIRLCYGSRHYDYHIPYANAEQNARGSDKRFAYQRANPLPGSAVGALPHLPVPAPSQHPSALEHMLGAVTLASALADVSQALYESPGLPSEPSRGILGGRCESDRNCHSGQRCAIPIHASTGVCLRPITENEFRDLVLPPGDALELDPPAG